MNILELSRHDVIGIDFDGTLIGHARSYLLQRFILEHPEKAFHLVTFRHRDWYDNIARDLRIDTMITRVPLDLSHFRGIHGIPETLVGHDLLILKDEAFWAWKGQKCRDLGCTVMIDDMHQMIAEHCTTVGVVCLNPDDY